MATHSTFDKARQRLGTQYRGFVLALSLLFSSSLVAGDYIVTIIDGVRVTEFGDKGKAPNQYPFFVGDLNVVSSVIVTNSKQGVLVSNLPEQEDD